jgi:hypothetical protein
MRVYLHSGQMEKLAQSCLHEGRPQTVGELGEQRTSVYSQSFRPRTRCQSTLEGFDEVLEIYFQTAEQDVDSWWIELALRSV